MDITAAITGTAQRYGVDPALALAVAQRESGLDPSARGAAGEIGLYQLMPMTAAGLGVDPYDLAQNIEGGIRYLRGLIDRFGDVAVALMAYNAGPGRVTAGDIPATAVQYARDVLALEGRSSDAALAAPVLSPGAPAMPAPELPMAPVLSALLLAAAAFLAFRSD